LDPRALTPRGAKAARSRAGRLGLSARCCRPSPPAPQVRRSSGVPRAVFEACSVKPPVDRRFQDFSHFRALDEALPTAIGLTGPARVWRTSRNGRHVLSGAQPARRDPTGWAAATDGTCHPPRPPHQPRRASPVWPRSAMAHLHHRSATVPASERPRARALGWDRARCTYIPIGILSRISVDVSTGPHAGERAQRASRSMVAGSECAAILGDGGYAASSG
jgi:hypothetical protein